ncbi:Uncharacterised protein [Mycobacterium tuberculosis]|uniref:Uncharacterized protein n=1 Tax=Mycobacterium tuberculosis TaxID=1773 RepID=A0A0U0R219_MYCTX|nr:Uncharacterised protein [Mycobacterium tuberculosis]COX04402.1 Uncharacterised protein [Mycobacterium tuberculosis]
MVPRHRPEIAFLVTVQRGLVPQPTIIRVRVFVKVVVVGVQDQFGVTDADGHSLPPVLGSLAPAKIRPTTYPSRSAISW